MYLTEESGLEQKWGAILDHPNMPKIKDAYRRSVTAIVLENQERANLHERQELFETPANASGAMPATGGVAHWDPVLISLVRRALPQLIAYDVCGVQPMQMPTGLIFAMKSKYTTQGGTEAMFDEVNSAFSGAGAQFGSNPAAPSALTGTITVATNSTAVTGVGTAFTTQLAIGAALFNAAGSFLGTIASVTDATNAVLTANALSAVTGAGALAFSYGAGMTTTVGEGVTPAEMAFSIEKTTVTAMTRALKAEYSIELAQDLKAVHGLDAESELTNILSQEILAEINREVLRSIYVTALPGARAGVVTTAGEFDLDIDANGRWSAENFKGLLFQIERDCNDIAQTTRRGKGNYIICSADVASALAMSGKLTYTPALSTDLTVNDTGSTFAGLLNGSIKVYIDPYSANYGSALQFYVAGYKGVSPYNAGIFYAPYVPLQMLRAVDPNTFQPKIGFKTRYGMTANPFATGSSAVITAGLGAANANVYFRKVKVLNLS